MYGGYFSTALHLGVAAEFMFSQYGPDVRRRANPAVLIGRSDAMHAGLERGRERNFATRS